MLAGLIRWVAGSGLGVSFVAISLPKRGVAGIRDQRRLLQAMRGADSMVLVGGSHFHDAYGRRSLPILTSHLALIAIARLLGCKVGLAGVGVGPLRRRSARLLIRLILALASDWFVRDEASAREAGATGEQLRMRVGFDLAAQLTIGQASASPRPGRRRVAVSLIPYFSSYLDDPRRDELLVETLADALAAAAADQPLAIDVLALNRRGRLSDVEVCGMLERRLVAQGLKASSWEIDDIDEFLDGLVAVDVLIATRYHAALLGFLAAKPMVVLAYEDKCRNLVEQIELDGAAVFSPEEALADLGKLTEAVLRLLRGDFVAKGSREEARRRTDERLGVMFGRLVAT